jgi:hypothetical protein
LAARTSSSPVELASWQKVSIFLIFFVFTSSVDSVANRCYFPCLTDFPSNLFWLRQFLSRRS